MTTAGPPFPSISQQLQEELMSFQSNDLKGFTLLQSPSSLWLGRPYSI